MTVCTGATDDSEADRSEADWHPDVRAILAYWRSIRPAPDLLPGRQHLDPARIVPLLPGIWMLDIHRHPFRLRYRLVGTAVVASHGRDLTGQWFDEAHGTLPPDYYARYEAVAEGHRPSWRRGAPYLDHRSRALTALENLVLPLATDGRTANILLCLTRTFRQPPNGAPR